MFWPRENFTLTTGVLVFTSFALTSMGEWSESRNSFSKSRVVISQGLYVLRSYFVAKGSSLKKTLFFSELYAYLYVKDYDQFMSPFRQYAITTELRKHVLKLLKAYEERNDEHVIVPRSLVPNNVFVITPPISRKTLQPVFDEYRITACVIKILNKNAE